MNTSNGYIKSLNAVRDECLNIDSFWLLDPCQGRDQRLEVT